MRSLSLTARLYTGFLVAFIIAALIGVVTYSAIQSQVKDQEWVEHSYQVRGQIKDIQKLLLDMETGRRGFRTTNEKRFLEPYFNGAQEIIPALNTLREKVSDNPSAVNEVNKLQIKIQDLMNYWRGIGEDINKYSHEQIVDITQTEKDRMDAIRGLVDTMTHHEAILLSQRNEATAKSINQTNWQVGVGTVLVELIIVLLIVVILREFRTRKTAEEKLQDNLATVQRLNAESNDRNWLLAGTGNVKDSLQEADDLDAMGERLLTAVLHYLNAPAGALYLWDEEHNRLQRIAAAGIQESNLTSFAPGTTIAGRAATEQKLVLIKDVPEDYWQLASGTGNALPGQILCLPLCVGKELKGVLEIASFAPFSPLAIELLQDVATNIAITINAAESRRRVLMLLAQVQQQNEEMEQQQEELRQTNEELTAQSEILQASEEELKVQEEELRQINSELEEKNETVETARQALMLKAQELEITGKYKSEFLANMSHELRTPLNSVLILAKLLSENKGEHLTAKQVEYALTIHKSGNDLLQLINDILDLSKIEAGKVEMLQEETSVKAIARDLRQMFTVVAEDKGIQFVQEIPHNTPELIYTDKQRVEQVLKNLLSNAFKFTPKGGRIEIGFRPVQLESVGGEGAGVAISVADNGIGIPKEKQQIIFEAFQQADGSTSRKYGGTGLGLSISKELAKRLGGFIRVVSEEGKGSTFTLYLPVRIAAGANHLAPQVTRPITPQQPQGFAQATPDMAITEQKIVADDRHNLKSTDKVMLIIEDDPSFAGIVRDFAHERGFKAIVAIQGDEGLYYARKYHPAAIILDMQLPVLDGWTLLRIFKQEATLKDIPVHVISAADNRTMPTEGAITYMAKPVSNEDLQKVFSLIGEDSKSGFKKVLVLSGDYLQHNSLRNFIEQRRFQMECDYAQNVDAAVTLMQQKQYDCIIADVARNMEEGIAALQKLRAQMQQAPIPVIVYIDKSLTGNNELQLKKVADVIIHDASQSKERLMDELELFVYRIQDVAQHKLPQGAIVQTDDSVLNGKKVLLADDDMRNVFALSTLLEQEGMIVVTAGDGKEALQALQTNPDTTLVLMDIMMPEMDGYEAIEHIRKERKHHKLPIIALTAKAMPGDREKSIQAGASDYITKPVDNNKLLSLLRVWLSQ